MIIQNGTALLYKLTLPPTHSFILCHYVCLSFPLPYRTATLRSQLTPDTDVHYWTGVDIWTNSLTFSPNCPNRCYCCRCWWWWWWCRCIIMILDVCVHLDTVIGWSLVVWNAAIEPPNDHRRASLTNSIFDLIVINVPSTPEFPPPLMVLPRLLSTSQPPLIMAHWLIDWLADWLTGWLADFLVGSSVG